MLNNSNEKVDSSLITLKKCISKDHVDKYKLEQEDLLFIKTMKYKG